MVICSLALRREMGIIFSVMGILCSFVQEDCDPVKYLIQLIHFQNGNAIIWMITRWVVRRFQSVSLPCLSVSLSLSLSHTHTHTHTHTPTSSCTPQRTTRTHTNTHTLFLSPSRSFSHSFLSIISLTYSLSFFLFPSLCLPPSSLSHFSLRISLIHSGTQIYSSLLIMFLLHILYMGITTPFLFLPFPSSSLSLNLPSRLPSLSLYLPISLSFPLFPGLLT